MSDKTYRPWVLCRIDSKGWVGGTTSFKSSKAAREAAVKLVKADPTRRLAVYCITDLYSGKSEIIHEQFAL